MDITTREPWFYRTNGVFLYNSSSLVSLLLIFTNQCLDILISEILSNTPPTPAVCFPCNFQALSWCFQHNSYFSSRVRCILTQNVFYFLPHGNKAGEAGESLGSKRWRTGNAICIPVIILVREQKEGKRKEVGGIVSFRWNPTGRKHIIICALRWVSHTVLNNSK